jgi:hypothetical protein
MMQVLLRIYDFDFPFSKKQKLQPSGECDLKPHLSGPFISLSFFAGHPFNSFAENYLR